ncbi:MAG: hypothetical protein LC797_02270 [Chloroflexi bacterium]|nr:hypothetical protein [Chloroflexota bacterium]
MFAFDFPTRAAACRSCGAYGNTKCSSTCQPGRVIKLGHPRRAARDARNSAAVRAQARVQQSLVRRL